MSSLIETECLINAWYTFQGREGKAVSLAPGDQGLKTPTSPGCPPQGAWGLCRALLGTLGAALVWAKVTSWGKDWAGATNVNVRAFLELCSVGPFHRLWLSMVPWIYLAENQGIFETIGALEIFQLGVQRGWEICLKSHSCEWESSWGTNPIWYHCVLVLFPSNSGDGDFTERCTVPESGVAGLWEPQNSAPIQPCGSFQQVLVPLNLRTFFGCRAVQDWYTGH